MLHCQGQRVPSGTIVSAIHHFESAEVELLETSAPRQEKPLLTRWSNHFTDALKSSHPGIKRPIRLGMAATMALEQLLHFRGALARPAAAKSIIASLLSSVYEGEGFEKFSLEARVSQIQGSISSLELELAYRHIERNEWTDLLALARYVGVRGTGRQRAQVQSSSLSISRRMCKTSSTLIATRTAAENWHTDYWGPNKVSLAHLCGGAGTVRLGRNPSSCEPSCCAVSEIQNSNSIFRAGRIISEGFSGGKVKEAFEKVAKDEARKLSTVQEIMIRSIGYLRRIRGKEALRCYTCARIVTVSRWKTTFGGSQGRKAHKIGCVRSVEKYMIGGHQTTGESVNQAKVFKAHAALQGLCGNLINGESARGWRRSPAEHCDEPLCGEQEGSRT